MNPVEVPQSSCALKYLKYPLSHISIVCVNLVYAAELFPVLAINLARVMSVARFGSSSRTSL